MTMLMVMGEERTASGNDVVQEKAEKEEAGEERKGDGRISLLVSLPGLCQSSLSPKCTARGTRES